MVWADRIVGEIKERFAKKIAKGQPLVIRDEKTLSGRVHVGSLRGIVIHGLIAQVLNEQGIPNIFRFELNDFDPMDEAPEKYLQHMGEPLWRVPDYSPLTLTLSRRAGGAAGHEPHQQGQNYPQLLG